MSDLWLATLRAELSQAADYPWSGVEAWIAKAKPHIRAHYPMHWESFCEQTKEPRWLSLPRFSSGGGRSGEPRRDNFARADAEEDAANRLSAGNARARILAFLDGLSATTEWGIEKPPHALDRVLDLCARFGSVAGHLQRRRAERPPLLINDEYDMQYLLGAALRLSFDDVREEEWTPSYAGGSARMDFLLKTERIVIEAKMARAGLGRREVGDQLGADILRYGAHPDCGTLVCFVYDPRQLLENPRGLERDLSIVVAGLPVVTLIRTG